MTRNGALNRSNMNTDDRDAQSATDPKSSALTKLRHSPFRVRTLEACSRSSPEMVICQRLANKASQTTKREATHFGGPDLYATLPRRISRPHELGSPPFRPSPYAGAYGSPPRRLATRSISVTSAIPFESSPGPRGRGCVQLRCCQLVVPKCDELNLALPWCEVICHGTQSRLTSTALEADQFEPPRHPPAYLPRRCLLCFVARRGEAAISPAVGCDWVLGLPPPGLGREILGMARS